MDAFEKLANINTLTAEFVKWTFPSLKVDQSIVNFRKIRMSSQQ